MRKRTQINGLQKQVETLRSLLASATDENNRLVAALAQKQRGEATKKRNGKRVAADVRIFPRHLKVLASFMPNGNTKDLTAREAMRLAGYSDIVNPTPVSDLKIAGLITATQARKGKAFLLTITDKGRSALDSTDKIRSAQ